MNTTIKVSNPTAVRKFIFLGFILVSLLFLTPTKTAFAAACTSGPTISNSGNGFPINLTVPAGTCTTFDWWQANGPATSPSASSNQTWSTAPVTIGGSYRFNVEVDNGTGNPIMLQSNTITVPAAPTTASLSASPTNVNSGSASTLTWGSTNATSCTGTGFNTGGATSGSVSTGSIFSDTGYSVSCTNGGTPGTASVTVTVNAPATASLNVNGSHNPTSTSNGSTVAISWSSTNATSCTGGGFNTFGATSGSVTSSSLIASYNFTLSCTNGATTGTDSVFVTVDPANVESYCPSTSDDSGGQSSCVIMSGAGSRASDLVTTRPTASFELTGWTSPPRSLPVYRGTGYQGPTLNPGGAGSAQTLPTNMVWVSGSNALWNFTLLSNYDYDFRASLSGAPDGSTTYLTGLVNIKQIQSAQITVNKTFSPAGCASGGTFQITPGFYTGSTNTVYPGSTIANNLIGTNYTLGSVSIPAPATAYTISNSDGGGAVMNVASNQSKTFNINYSCPAVVAPAPTLTANPTSVTSDQSSTLTWTPGVLGVPTSCTASAVPATIQWGGTTNPSVAGGNKVITNITQTTTYTINCTNTGGTGTANATVTVLAPPTLSNAGGAACGGNVNLSWTAVSGATAYKIYRNGSLVTSVAGTTYIDTAPAVSTSYNYTIKATNGTIDSADSNTVAITSSVACPVNVVPTVTSPTATSITSTGATLGANITSAGVPATLTARGTCWGTMASPSLTNGATCLADGLTATGIFTQIRTGMSAGTSYNYQGYATNSTGTGYSGNATFTTSLANAVPTVTSPTATSITSSGATLGADVTSLGVPASISARGTCWATTPLPTTNCTPAEGGLTTGVFTQAKTLMPPSTTIYYRGYATNTTGTGYSVDGSFFTSAINALPTVTSPTATSITSTGATLGANITSAGVPATLTARGTCWATTANPIIGGVGVTCLADGLTATGVFTHARTGMSAGIFYHYQGYATNSTGTGYSGDATFTTTANPVINVTQSPVSGGSWSFSGPGGTFSGASNSVTPGIYTLAIPTPPSGYTYTSSDCSPPLVTGCNTINAVAGSTYTFAINYTIIPAFNYSLSAQNVSVFQGQPGSSGVTETYISGTAEGVNISAAGFPAGVSNISYPGQGCTPDCPASVNFTVGGSVLPGPYPITVTGTSITTSVVKSAPAFTLTVVAPPSVGCSVSSNPLSSAVVGQTVTWSDGCVPAGVPPCTYSWSGTDIPGGSTGAVNTYTFTYQTTGTKSITATATCSGVSNSGSASITVGVKPSFKEF